MHPLKSYTCHAATMPFCGSFGLKLSHWLMSLLQSRPPSAITFVAPVPRTALTRVCIPATLNDEQFPPSRQQLQLMPYGSLNISKITELFPLSAFATCCQNRGEWSAS